MPKRFERSAKFIVSAVTRPMVTAEKVGHAAVERVVGWLGHGDRGRYAALVEQVRARLEQLPAHEIGGAERIERALSTTEAHFAADGLTIDDLVRRRLDRQAAIAEQQRRFDRWPPGQGAEVGPICREHVIPAVLNALLADEGALKDIDLAFKQAVLAHRDEIRKVPRASAMSSSPGSARRCSRTRSGNGYRAWRTAPYCRPSLRWSPSSPARSS